MKNVIKIEHVRLALGYVMEINPSFNEDRLQNPYEALVNCIQARALVKLDDKLEKKDKIGIIKILENYQESAQQKYFNNGYIH